MRPRSSRLANSLILTGLIAYSLLLVVVLNGVPEPVAPVRTILTPSDKAADGFLLIILGTNQDPNHPTADPSNSSLFPIAGKQIMVLNQTDPGSFPHQLMTNGSGVANSSLIPGRYVVKFDYHTLHPVIPVVVTKGNLTILGVRVTGILAPAIFSEFSDLSSTGVPGQGTDVLLIHSPLRVANLSDSMIVKVRGPGTAVQIANATVIGERLVTDGLWLQMGVPSELNTSGSSGVDLTVYAYSYEVVTVPALAP
jgi:hypothetical protein